MLMIKLFLQRSPYLILLLNFQALIVLIATENFLSLPMVLLSAFLLFLLPFLGRVFRLHIPPIFELFLVTLIFGSLVLGEGFGYYFQIAWWDNFLHALAGFLLGVIGIFLFSSKPRLGALSFAALGSTVWEIFEFVGDRLFGTNMQKDSIVLPPVFPFLSVDTVGTIDVGLQDSMFDLCFGILGAVLLLMLYYFTPTFVNTKLLIVDTRKESL